MWQSDLKRVYARGRFPSIDDDSKAKILESYEDTYYPENTKANKYIYVQRNYDMINKSAICVFYYDDNYILPMRTKRNSTIKYRPNSGTKTAYEYALKKHKKIINMFDKTEQ